MVTINSNGHEIKLFTAADELPIKRYSAFQRYSLMESGIGSDMDAIGGHFAKLFEYLGYGMQDKALAEGKNLYYNFFMMLDGINIPGLQFACLVHSIDGKPVEDITEAALNITVEELSACGISQADVELWAQNVKKKSLRS